MFFHYWRRREPPGSASGPHFHSGFIATVKKQSRFNEAKICNGKTKGLALLSLNRFINGFSINFPFQEAFHNSFLLFSFSHLRRGDFRYTTICFKAYSYYTRHLHQTLTIDTYTRHLHQTLTIDTYNRHLHQTLTIDTYTRHLQQTLAKVRTRNIKHPLLGSFTGIIC